MGRLQPALLVRIEAFADRMVDLAEQVSRERKLFRLCEQMSACGTSAGANLYEADEAMSRADFAKTMGIVLKELNESRFWLRMCARRSWISPDLVGPIELEATELKRVIGAIIFRTRANGVRSAANAR